MTASSPCLCPCRHFATSFESPHLIQSRTLPALPSLPTGCVRSRPTRDAAHYHLATPTKRTTTSRLSRNPRRRRTPTCRFSWLRPLTAWSSSTKQHSRTRAIIDRLRSVDSPRGRVKTSSTRRNSSPRTPAKNPRVGFDNARRDSSSGWRRAHRFDEGSLKSCSSWCTTEFPGRLGATQEWRNNLRSACSGIHTRLEEKTNAGEAASTWFWLGWYAAAATTPSEARWCHPYTTTFDEYPCVVRSRCVLKVPILVAP